MKDVKIKYNDTFGTIHSRDYYKGKSFHYAGEWIPGAHYFSDDYNVDFIVKDNCLLACARSHFSTLDNEPKDFICDVYGNKKGIASRYWDFVLSPENGITPQIKLEDDAWWVSYDEGNTWVKLDDLQVDASWGDETETTINTSIGNITKSLLKSSAIDYSEKIVGSISDDDAADILNIFFPLPNN